MCFETKYTNLPNVALACTFPSEIKQLFDPDIYMHQHRHINLGLLGEVTQSWLNIRSKNFSKKYNQILIPIMQKETGHLHAVFHEIWVS